MGMIHIPPRSSRRLPNLKCTTVKYVDGKPVDTPKKRFASDVEAIAEARRLNCMERQIHKAVAYKCGTCGCWHVGRTNKVLTPKERERYRLLAGVIKRYTPHLVKPDISDGNFKPASVSAETIEVVRRNMMLREQGKC